MKKRQHRRPLPDLETILSSIDIDVENGTFTHKHRPLSSFASEHGQNTWNRRFAGKPAGWVDKKGYLQITINYKKYMAHRLLWKVATGEEPEELDHIDRNQLNNRKDNLRAATRSENNLNRRMSKYNSTGFNGIYRGRNGRWVAQLKLGGIAKHLGAFDTIEEAVAARHGAEQALSHMSKIGHFEQQNARRTKHESGNAG